MNTAERQVWFQEFKQKMQAEARSEGLSMGRCEEAVRSLLTVLRARGLLVPEPVQQRIHAEKDPERLERWLERAVTAASAAEAIDDRP